MKLLGITDGKHIVASLAHYDCRTHGDLMADGGQPLTQDYPGYNRFSVEGKSVWFEIPQTYADLYNDYQFNSTPSGAVRKYGIWNYEDVKILDYIPDKEDKELLFENYIWGTNGKNGDQPTKYVLLKDCELDHLENILKYCGYRLREDITECIKYWIEKKK